jgi:3-deoxy-D-manno-octulosonate 8-phosphate phosphatase (KDO 8-P phosphatase)
VINRKDVKLFVMNNDGVLTDGSLNYDRGVEAVKIFNVLDGLGIRRVGTAGI